MVVKGMRVELIGMRVGMKEIKVGLIGMKEMRAGLIGMKEMGGLKGLIGMKLKMKRLGKMPMCVRICWNVCCH